MGRRFRRLKNKNFPRRYIRTQYGFGIIFAVIAAYFIYPSLSLKMLSFSLFICAWVLLNTAFYPYTVFTLGHLLRYGLNGNALHLPKIITYSLQLVFMVLCWVFSIILLPLGLVWYYLIYYDPDAEFY